jgi:hypothetical protein
VVSSLRTRNGAGVSTAVWSLVVANGLLWLLRAALHHEPAVLVSNVLSGSMALVVLGSLSRTHPRQAVLELLGVLASVVGVLLPSQRHPIAFDVATLLVTYVRYLPRASTALQSDDLSGVALSTWIPALASVLT